MKHFEVKEFELGGARNIKQRRNPAVEDFDEFEQKGKDIDHVHDEKLANLKRKLPKVLSAIEEHRRNEAKLAILLREREEAESREEAERLTALSKVREAIERSTAELTEKKVKIKETSMRVSTNKKENLNKILNIEK